ncbi:sugar acetyltransferase [Dermacoccus sp. 147Ba]|nr:sugar acetyltransferase [Dermacoccus sp. 147Ba]
MKAVHYPRIGIIGAGGHGREVAQTVARVNGADDRSPRRELAGFFDDNCDDARVKRLGFEILGPCASADLPCLVGIGSGAIRRTFDEVVETAPPTIDMSALVGDDVTIGPGAVVFANAMVTTNISLGRHVHIGRGASIGHDSVVRDYASVMPLASISGGVTIGEAAFIGTGALIRQGLTIGAGATVGMGAVVLQDVAPGATVVGNPARQIG